MHSASFSHHDITTKVTDVPLRSQLSKTDAVYRQEHKIVTELGHSATGNRTEVAHTP